MKLRVRIVYGICSYCVALVLLFFPVYSSEKAVAAASIIPFLAGALLLAGTALTNYEMGIAPLMRFRDTVVLTIIGSALVLISLVFVSYGSHLALIAILTTGLGVISYLAHKSHQLKRNLTRS